MSDIFISYASHDRAKAKILAETLQQRGWSVWWDRNIPPGRSFDQVIEEALAAAKCVIVLWSRASASSDWVKTEAAEGARRRILVPALIENVTIPLEFRRIQTANLSDWHGSSPHSDFDELLQAVATLLGSAVPKPTPGPTPAKFNWHYKHIKVAVLVAVVIVTLTTAAVLRFLIGRQTKQGLIQPVVQNAYMDYSLDLARWSIKGFRPASIDLLEQPLANNWIEPPSKGLKRLYGILTFGSKTKVGVILDVLDDTESQMVFAFDGETNFTDKPIYKTVKGSLPDPIEFQIAYPDGIRQKYAIRVYYPVSFAREIGAHRLHYYRASVRQGKIKLGDADYPLAVGDGNSDGQYSDLQTTELWIDISRERIGAAKPLRAASAFSVAGTYYIISDITPSGSRITVRQARFGEVVGQVVNAEMGTPLPGTKITLSPNDISAVAESNGRYHIRAPEGEYWQLAALAEGYVPNYRP